MRFKVLSRPLNNTYLLVRHGETQYNSEKRYQGHSDIELNENGIQQALSILLPTKVDVMYTSPLKRALQTAQAIKEKHSISELIVHEALKEKSGGKLEGMYFNDIAEQYAELWNRWYTHELEDIVSVQFPDGESDLDVAARLENFLQFTEETHDAKHILLVTHSGIIQSMRYLFGYPKERIFPKEHLKNGEVEVFLD